MDSKIYSVGENHDELGKDYDNNGGPLINCDIPQRYYPENIQRRQRVTMSVHFTSISE